MNAIRRIACLIGLLAVLGLIFGCDLFNRPPEASFVAIYNVTADPLVVDLDASASTDPDGDAIVAYAWDFGDDVDIITPLTVTKLVTVPLLRVRYPVEGEYIVRLLWVQDEKGNLSTAQQTETLVLPNLPVGPTP